MKDKWFMSLVKELESSKITSRRTTQDFGVNLRGTLVSKNRT